MHMACSCRPAFPVPEIRPYRCAGRSRRGMGWYCSQTARLQAHTPPPYDAAQRRVRAVAVQPGNPRGSQADPLALDRQAVEIRRERRLVVADTRLTTNVSPATLRLYEPMPKSVRRSQRPPESGPSVQQQRAARALGRHWHRTRQSGCVRAPPPARAAAATALSSATTSQSRATIRSICARIGRNEAAGARAARPAPPSPNWWRLRVRRQSASGSRRWATPASGDPPSEVIAITQFPARRDAWSHLQRLRTRADFDTITIVCARIG